MPPPPVSGGYSRETNRILTSVGWSYQTFDVGVPEPCVVQRVRRRACGLVNRHDTDAVAQRCQRSRTALHVGVARGRRGRTEDRLRCAQLLTPLDLVTHELAEDALAQRAGQRPAVDEP